MSDKKKTYTIEETAEILGIGRTLAYKMVNAGKIPGLKLGRRLVVPAKALEKLLEKCD